MNILPFGVNLENKWEAPETLSRNSVVTAWMCRIVSLYAAGAEIAERRVFGCVWAPSVLGKSEESKKASQGRRFKSETEFTLRNITFKWAAC